ncbi:hypothetical protein [Solirubrobacter deserti]|uniref:MucB/RseB N-terminal domain-containing protein n=1 Tax=Solirubrobacter deserti TaxID=2282478 RepID=A0ABT4RBL7_9ACTN|nr:hypothetical protein [Solirubrobacter deserti]MDA0135932.1 hypothetical protein [Solirubrobacter deserti]
MLDRVRAANPASEDEFAGRANFDALSLPPRRRRKRWLTLPAVGAVVAALVVLPTSAPQATEVLEHAVNAVEVDGGGILYARSKAQWGPTDAPPTGTQSRQVWVQGGTAMRWLEDGGNEEVYRQGEGTTRRDPAGKVTEHPEMQMVPTEIFRVQGLLDRARNVGLEETDDAYVLRWNEKSGPPHWPRIEMTLWVDKDTYAPLRFTDHSWGKDVKGEPFDHTYREEILEFKTLPDTPENRRLLQLG